MQVLELQQGSTKHMEPVLQKKPCENLELLALVTTGNPQAENTAKGRDSWQTGLSAKLAVNLCTKEVVLPVFYSQDFNGAWIPGS